jgi:spore germination cell wall hydrolase CwlJ-like protein
MRYFILPILLLLSISTTGAQDLAYDETDYSQLTKKEQRQVNCLAQNIFFESGAEPYKGKVAVAMVTINRTKASQYPDNICGVVKQKVKGVCQFSWVCNSEKNIVYYKKTETYQDILKLATFVYLNNDYINDITKGATHFHTVDINPGWYNLKRTIKIGRHVFYKSKQKVSKT